MYLLVSYDVVLDRRRRRLAKSLAQQLQRVQYSVFEGPLPERRLHALREAAAKHIHPPEDSVRIYTLCARCRESLEILGCGPIIDDPDDVIV
ncbi:MAG: CRISPR-associated endonuclease Cas2 [Planctomycetes bacterium]|nr:CRISPR-associated endonuclease Cas2 [Planctomycetota bacterium]